MAPLNSDDMHMMKRFIINNPSLRNIEELARRTGYNERSIRKALKELNITRSTKPEYYVG